MLKKLTTPFKEFGAFGGAAYLIDQLMARVSKGLRLFFYELMIQPIPDKALIPAAFIKSLEFREIERGDAEVDLMPARAEIKESRFEQGAVCLGMFKASELLGYIWLAQEEYEEDEVKCTFELHPKEASVFDFDLYILPEHRKGMAFVSLWEGTNQYLRSRGVTHSYSRLTRFNVESRRAHDHLGWKCVGKAVILKLWQVELMAATVSPFVHISLSTNSRAKVKMTPDVLAVQR